MDGLLRVSSNGDGLWFGLRLRSTVAVHRRGLLLRRWRLVHYRLLVVGLHFRRGYRLRGGGWRSRVGTRAEPRYEYPAHQVVISHQVDDPALAPLSVNAPGDDRALEDAIVREAAQGFADIVLCADISPVAGDLRISSLQSLLEGTTHLFDQVGEGDMPGALTMFQVVCHNHEVRYPLRVQAVLGPSGKRERGNDLLNSGSKLMVVAKDIIRLHFDGGGFRFWHGILRLPHRLFNNLWLGADLLVGIKPRHDNLASGSLGDRRFGTCCLCKLW